LYRNGKEGRKKEINDMKDKHKGLERKTGDGR
jgi:hypothetical protein